MVQSSVRGMSRFCDIVFQTSLNNFHFLPFLPFLAGVFFVGFFATFLAGVFLVGFFTTAFEGVFFVGFLAATFFAGVLAFTPFFFGWAAAFFDFSAFFFCEGFLADLVAGFFGDRLFRGFLYLLRFLLCDLLDEFKRSWRSRFLLLAKTFHHWRLVSMQV